MQNSTQLLTVFLLFLSSCIGEKNHPEESLKQNTDITAQQSLDADTCLLSKYSTRYNGDTSIILYEHDKNKRLKSATFVLPGMENNESAIYSYNEAGTLKKIEIENTTVSYHYNPEGGLKKIEHPETGYAREFEYNDKGQIIKEYRTNQDTKDGYLQYTYNPSGAPIRAELINSKGDHQVSYLFKYDRKINPEAGHGYFINDNESTYGYPVGNYRHNLIEVQTTYEMDVNMTDLSRRKAGETDVVRVSFKYNSLGYPVQKSGFTDDILEYQCE